MDSSFTRPLVRSFYFILSFATLYLSFSYCHSKSHQILNKTLNLSSKGFRVLLKKHDITQESGEGNGTPLQYFCLENPMDGGAL